MSIYQITEATEASRSKLQALEALAEIFRDNGPGAMTQMYEDAAISSGASYAECEAVYRRRCTCPSGDGSLRSPCPTHQPELRPSSSALASPSGQLLTDVYDTALRHGWDPRTQGSMSLARCAGVPELDLQLALAMALITQPSIVAADQAHGQDEYARRSS
jgi:hypothetical protein